MGRRAGIVNNNLVILENISKAWSLCQRRRGSGDVWVPHAEAAGFRKKVSAMYIYHPATSSIKQLHRSVSSCPSNSLAPPTTPPHPPPPSLSHSFWCMCMFSFLCPLHPILFLISISISSYCWAFFSLSTPLSFSLLSTSVLVYPDLLWFLPLSFLSLFFLATGSNYTPWSAGRVRWKVGIVCWATATRCCSHPSCTDQ